MPSNIKRTIESNRITTLEEVIIAFQKSLARVRQKTTGVSKYDSQFSKGERVLYLVDNLDIELKASFFIIDDPNDIQNQNDKVGVNLDSPEIEKSTIRFSVSQMALDKIEDKEILIAQSPYNKYEYKISLINFALGQDKEFVLKFSTSGLNPEEREFKLITDRFGNLRILLFEDGEKLIIDGDTDELPLKLNKKREWYLWAEKEIVNIDRTVISLKSDVLKLNL